MLEPQMGAGLPGLAAALGEPRAACHHASQAACAQGLTQLLFSS